VDANNVYHAQLDIIQVIFHKNSHVYLVLLGPIKMTIVEMFANPVEMEQRNLEAVRVAVLIVQQDITLSYYHMQLWVILRVRRVQPEHTKMQISHHHAKNVSLVLTKM
jgi:hypothetical protein